jgi:hypothetical protein
MNSAPASRVTLQRHILEHQRRRARATGELSTVLAQLDPHTTKNDEGRTFPFTDALQQLLEAQKVEHDRLKAEDVIWPVGLSPYRQESQRQTNRSIHEVVEEGVREGRLSRSHSA